MRDDLAWMAGLMPPQQQEVFLDLVADERCACDHRDDQHDAEGVCEKCPPDVCFAYNPIQQ